MNRNRIRLVFLMALIFSLPVSAFAAKVQSTDSAVDVSGQPLSPAVDSSTGSAATPVRAQTDTVTAVSRQITPSTYVTIDPRIELIAVVALLSGYGDRTGLINTDKTSYLADVEAYFARFKEHQAVRLFTEIGTANELGFDHDAPPAMMLHLSPPPQLDVVAPFDDAPADIQMIVRRAGGRERLYALIDALRTFARDSDFGAFYKAHNEAYSKMIDRYVESLGNCDYAGALEQYHGRRFHSCTTIPAPLFRRGSYGTCITRPDGSMDVYCISEAMLPIRNGLPSFGSGEIVRYLCWHEWGHLFVNAVLTEHQAELAKYYSLFEPVTDGMRDQDYDMGVIVLLESVDRAVHVRLTTREIGPQEGEAQLELEVERGFFLVPALCKRLEEYEENRDKYPTFESFFPRLLSVFEEAAAKRAEPDISSTAAEHK